MHALLMLLVVLCGLGLARPALTQTPRLEAVVRIGVVEGAAEYVFGSIGGLLLHPNRRLLVLDEQAAQLRVYDLSGKYLYSFGRTGSGPGEFQAPASPSLTGDRVTVFDGRLQRYSTFTLAGDHIVTARAPEAAGRLSSLVPLRGDGWIALKAGGISSEHIGEVVAGRARQSGTGISHVLVFRASRTDTLLSFQEGGVYWYNADTGAPFGGLPGFGNAALWAVSGDTTVVVVDAIRGRIDWYRAEASSLRRTGSTNLGLRAMPVTRAELNEKEQELRQTHAGIRRYAFVTPDFRAHFSNAVLDDRGRVWLARRPRNAGDTTRPITRYLVVSPGGVSSFEITVPGRFSLGVVHGDLVVGTMTDDNDVEYVQVFRLKP